MKQSLILLLIALAPMFALAQQNPESPPNAAFCGNDLLTRNIEAEKQFNERLQKFQKNKQETPGKGGFQYIIPVVIYEVNCNQYAAPLFTPQQAEGQIAILNQFFNHYDIQFCLATEEDGHPLPGNPLPGVIRVNSNPECTPTIPDDWADVVELSNLDPDRYLRIFVVRTFTNFGLLGVGSFPWLPSNQQGILVKSDAFGNIGNCGGCNLAPFSELGRTLVHEVGHYLGLYHTFEGGCGDPNDCASQGDMLCDTPPDGLLYYGIEDCPANPAIYACPGAQPPLIHNMMTYTGEECRHEFTGDQIAKMQDVLTVDRSLLVSQDNLVYTGVNCTPTVYCNIYASNSTPCEGETVQFNNFNYPDATFTWHFDDDGSTQTGLPVDHTFMNAGHYTVTLTIELNGSTTVCDHDVYVSDCTPINSSQGLWYFGFWGGLDFSTGTPLAELSAYNFNTMFTDGGSVVQADNNNDLLFYSDGINLYNGSHQQVNSAQLLAGSYGSAQAGISMLMPGQDSRYYLFVPGSSGQLTYSIVANTGSGIALSQVNTVVNPSVTDYSVNPITAIPFCDGTGYWVLVARTLYPDEVHVYRVDINGISLASTFSSISGGINAIKAAPDGSKVVLCGGPFTVCDFNGATGVLSNEKKISNFAFYASFSPNSELVYSNLPTAPTTSRILQYQVTDPDPSTTEVVLDNLSEVIGSLQTGPDGKIYIARKGRHQLAVINYPDVTATSGNNECGFTLNGPLLDIPTSRLGLPNFIDAGTSGCDDCAEQITVEKDCRVSSEGRYFAHVTLYYQGQPIAMYNDPNCCVTWEYLNGIPSIPCPRPNAYADQNFNPMNLSQGQHYKVTIICGDCTYEEEDYIDCWPNRPGPGEAGTRHINAGKEKSGAGDAFAYVYPNPAKNEIAIRLQQEAGADENYTLQIVDAYGRQVLNHTLLGSTQWQLLDISSFTPGVYAWYLTGEGKDKVLEKGKIIVIP